MNENLKKKQKKRDPGSTLRFPFFFLVLVFLFMVSFTLFLSGDREDEEDWCHLTGRSGHLAN